jgi:membrane-associated PAP2 superfamily phosphatase
MAKYELYDHFKNTLEMLSGDMDEMKILAIRESLAIDEIIQDYLHELEGDVHTFLHSDSILKLKQHNQISHQVMDMTLVLKMAVEKLPKDLWNASSFKSGNEWKEIHKKAKKILTEISSLQNAVYFQ